MLATMRMIGTLVLVLSLSACVGDANLKADSPAPASVAECSADNQKALLADDSFRVALWQQTAAEYDALSFQVFARAQSRLKPMLKRPRGSAVDRGEYAGSNRGKPAAIISDIDETLLDNSGFMVRQMREPMPACLSIGDAYAEWVRRWFEWAEEAQAPPMPGAVAFMQQAADQGVRIFYVTNRKDSEKTAACENLIKAKFPLDDCAAQVLTRNDEAGRGRDKVSRRQQVAQKYRVLMLFGDNLGDFIGNVQTNETQRDALVAAKQNWWGRRWFMLPNAGYGSWEEIQGRLDESAQSFATATERNAAVRALKEARLQDCRQRKCLQP